MSWFCIITHKLDKTNPAGMDNKHDRFNNALAHAEKEKKLTRLGRPSLGSDVSPLIETHVY